MNQISYRGSYNRKNRGYAGKALPLPKRDDRDLPSSDEFLDRNKLDDESKRIYDFYRIGR